MIGNDVVDLRLADQQSNWRRKGFQEKVFTDLERRILASVKDKHKMVWLLWSMKEAAYKAHQRKRSLLRRLNWTVQECISVEFQEHMAKGIVQIQDDKYFSFSTITSEYIHTTAVDQENSPYKEKLIELPLPQTKHLFMCEISQELGMVLSELRLKKSKTGIPQLYHKNRSLPLAISFSDHGKYSGFCVALTNS